MTQPNSTQGDYEKLELCISSAHPCGYLPDSLGATLFVNPTLPMDVTHYEVLLAHGFRRSGNIVYRPWCGNCTACIPIRVVVNQFHPNRSFRRIITRNQDLTVHIEEPTWNEERFDLYVHYMNSRHGDGPMANPTPEDFNAFFLSNWCTVRFVDFRLQGRLLLTAIMDQLPNSLSAVYSFFDPTHPARSLGSYAILWEIEQARLYGLTWLYLGYWIEESPKMRYKSHFKPLEAFIMRQWQPLENH